MGLIEYIEKLPWMIGAATAVAIFVLFTIVGIISVRAIVQRKNLKAHHDVAGFVFANLGVLYAVLLGFTVVNVQQRFDKIKEVTQVEASYLAELYRDAAIFSDKDKDTIRVAIEKYGNSIVDQEWNLMAKGQDSPETIQALKNIWTSYYQVTIANKKQELWYSLSITKLNLLLDVRLARLMGTKESLGDEMWTFLIMGGLIVVAFIWFFSLDSLITHLLMASILAATTAFLLFLIYSLDTAFKGEVNIQPEALKSVITSFERTEPPLFP